MKIIVLLIILILLGVLSDSNSTKNSSEIRVLLTGEFHGGDVSAKTGEIWYGLYPTETGFEIKASKLAINLIRDYCADGPEEKTGKYVSVTDSRKPLFLIKGLEGIIEGPVITLYSGKKFIYPGEHWNFKLEENRYYSFCAFGHAFDRDKRGGSIDKVINDYSLKMSRIPWKTSQILVNLGRLDLDNPPTFYWVGDLDRDGELDFYMDLSNSYVGNRYTLFLSTKAAPGFFVKNVAFFLRSGC